jgi:hypothetical protein
MPDTASTKPPRPTPKGAPSASRSQAVTTRAKDAANDVSTRILEGVDANPVAVLAGGIALGLFAGALLPKTRLEGQYLAPLGAKLNEGARTAASAAAEAGRTELAAAGLSRVGANEQLGKILEAFGGALRSAGEAARETRKRRA